MDPRNLAELSNDSALAWLRSPAPMAEEPFGVGQDWSLVFPGALDGGLPGHMRIYLHERIPNPEKRRFLLNAVYVLAWHELVLLFPKKPGVALGPGPLPDNADNLYEHLRAALDIADRAGNLELTRWANAVRWVLEHKKHPRYGFWCGWGWLWQWRFILIWWP
ncbi:MAG: hypothetical protein ACYC96_03345 [Fimbriimonadaceae bacterium]